MGTGHKSRALESRSIIMSRRTIRRTVRRTVRRCTRFIIESIQLGFVVVTPFVLMIGYWLAFGY